MIHWSQIMIQWFYTSSSNKLTRPVLDYKFTCEITGFQWEKKWRAWSLGIRFILCVVPMFKTFFKKYEWFWQKIYANSFLILPGTVYTALVSTIVLFMWKYLHVHMYICMSQPIHASCSPFFFPAMARYVVVQSLCQQSKTSKAVSLLKFSPSFLLPWHKRHLQL